jgi:CheY-like chemotaxis protein
MSRTLPSTNLRPGDLEALKVLVVDDNRTLQRLIRDVLRAGGVGQVETANDGMHAREMIARWDPHIIFSDWHMPVMDGLELARSIRRAAVRPDSYIPNPKVPVIIVTAERSAVDVESARRAGVNEFVIKPFTPAGLLSRIQLVLTKPREFIISEDYVGPDRRRRAELSYSGPMRRMSDPAEVATETERCETRDTISVELEALRALVLVRGGFDRDTLKMTYRVIEHTVFRARQVRDPMLHRAATALLSYVDAMGGPERCDAAVLDEHFVAIGALLKLDPDQQPQATAILERLDALAKSAAAGAKAA